MDEHHQKGISTLLDEDILQHELMRVAFTHASADYSYDNERLEFLGDAVLGSLIAKILYQKFTTAEEGKLTRWRSYLVCRETLSAIAGELQLSEWIIVGAGEEKSRGRYKQSILANTLEAVIGALYLIKGEQTVDTFIEAIFSDWVDKLLSLGDLKDAKSSLQELMQKDGYALPLYGGSKQISDQQFQVQCQLAELGIETIGYGSSKNKAEQDAAQKAIEAVKNR